MFTLHTKSVIHMLRTLLLLIAFSIFNVYANAHKSNDGCCFGEKCADF
jgi:hypothetical protein